MALDFPNNPTVGDTTTQGEFTYIWTAELRWEIVQGVPINGMPVGAVYWCPYETPLEGSIALTEVRQVLSRTTYAALWNVISAKAGAGLAASDGAALAGQFGPGDGSTTFTLPTASGYFLRAFGGGADPDVRVFGDVQAALVGPHSHPITNAGSVFERGVPGGTDATAGGMLGNSAGAVLDPAITTDANVGAETRPINIAWNLAIVAFNTISSAAELNAAEVVGEQVAQGNRLTALESKANASVSTNVWTSITTIVPFDDTIPLVTEGEQILTLAFTASSASAKVRVYVYAPFATASASSVGAMSIYDGTTHLHTFLGFNAIANGLSGIVGGEFIWEPGDTLEHTLNVRLGPNAGTLWINGNSAGRQYGGSLETIMNLQEL